MKRVTMHVPTPLRTLSKGKARLRLQVEGDDLGSVLGVLAQDYKDLAKALIDDKGELLPHVVLYVDDDDARYVGRYDAKIERDVYVVVPTVV
jgi:hypothetical protein